MNILHVILYNTHQSIHLTNALHIGQESPTNTLDVDSLRETLGFEVVCTDARAYVVDSMTDLLEIHPGNVRHVDPEHIIDHANHRSDTAVAKFHEDGHTQFNVMMIDIKDLEADSYSGSCAPPRWLITVDMLTKIKGMITDDGAVILYVIPPDAVFYANVVNNMKKVFANVYEIKLTNDKHNVLVATSGPSDFPTFTSGDEAEEYDKLLLRTSIPAFTMDVLS